MSLAMPPRSTKRPARTSKSASKGKVKVPSKLVYFFGAKGTEGDGSN